MGDRLVALPAQVAAAQKKHDTISLLVTIGCFAYPQRWMPSDLERDLELRFATQSSIEMADIAGWLSDAGIAAQDLATLVAEFEAGNREPLHLSLMTGNDAGSLSLLSLADGAALVDLTLGRALPSGPVYLLRVGYNSDDGTAYYYPSLPGYGATPAKIAWSSIASAQVLAGLTIPAAKPALDVSAIEQPLHIMEQALVAANQAHASILSTLGLSGANGAGAPIV